MRWIGRFRSDEHGSATIEFLLWIPIITALITIMIDATALWVTHKEMWNVARDTARRMVTGALMSESEAESYALDAMSLRDYPYFVNATYDVDAGAEVVIVLQVKDMAIMGYASPLQIIGGNMAARVHMRADPNMAFGASGGGGGASSGNDDPPAGNEDPPADTCKNKKKC